MNDAKRIAKLEAQIVSLRSRLAARTDQLLLVLLQIDDLKRTAIADSSIESSLRMLKEQADEQT